MKKKNLPLKLALNKNFVLALQQRALGGQLNPTTAQPVTRHPDLTCNHASYCQSCGTNTTCRTIPAGGHQCLEC